MAAEDAPVCYICLESDEEAGRRVGVGELVHGGCGCRGSAGFAHLPCLVSAAESNSDSWIYCPTCKQKYTGRAAFGLAQAAVNDERLSPGVTQTNLANALADKGEWAEAKRLYQEILAGVTAQLGPAHTSTLATKMNLASLLRDMGERAEAKRLYQEVVAGETAQLGPAHTSTLMTKNSLAILLRDMGEQAEAKRLLEEVLVGETAQLGPLHDSTLNTKGNLASLLNMMGEGVEAKRLYQEVLADQTAQLGPAHTATLMTKGNLAVLLHGIGEHVEALRLCNEAVAGFMDQHGAEHPRTKGALENLVLITKAHDNAFGTACTAAFKPAPGPGSTAAAGTAEAVVVRLAGLVNAAEHNGKLASVLGFAPNRGRFILKLQADGKELWVKPANMEVVAVPVGLAVRVGGLVGAAQHNGKCGRVVGGPDPATGRCKVRLDGAESGAKPLGLKPANLRLLSSLARDANGDPTVLPYSTYQRQADLDAAVAQLGAEEAGAGS
jgi:hypothetical protein